MTAASCRRAAALLQGVAFVALASGQAAWPFDSRNISESEWQCGNGTAAAVLPLSLTFPGLRAPLAPACGAEVPQPPSQVLPTIAVPALGGAAPQFATILVVDRDAPSAGSPIRSPLRHMALSRVPGALLAAGVNASSLAAAAAAGAALERFFNYSGPSPPAGTLCHRYYVLVYAEDPAVAPSLNITAGEGRYMWDFPQWAALNNLTKLAEGMWRTQNAGARTGDCDTPAPAPPPSGDGGSNALSLGLGLGIPLALAGVASLWLARARMRGMFSRGGSRAKSAEKAFLTPRRPGSSFLDADASDFA